MHETLPFSIATQKYTDGRGLPSSCGCQATYQPIAVGGSSVGRSWAMSTVAMPAAPPAARSPSIDLPRGDTRVPASSKREVERLRLSRGHGHGRVHEGAAARVHRDVLARGDGVDAVVALVVGPRREDDVAGAWLDPDADAAGGLPGRRSNGPVHR